jgi:hypothetical protein
VTPAARAAIDTAISADRRRVPEGATLVGVGWSTVDGDRAAAELGLEVADAAGDAALGASSRIGATADGLTIVLLEPSTEGRLSASLARLGEGPVATWWDVDSGDGLDLAPDADGPFGVVRRLREPASDHRFRFLRSRRAATINT